MPKSIAPAALAQHLDDGWGDDAELGSPPDPGASGVTSAPLVPASTPPPLDSDGDWELPSAESTACIAGERPANEAGTDQLRANVAAPAIDITIEPSFPQVTIDPELQLKLSNPVEPAEPVAAESQPLLRLMQPSKSLSPITAASPRVAKRSKLWLLVAAGALVVGTIWGIAGAQRASKSAPRRGLLEPVAMGVNPRPPDPAMLATASIGPETVRMQNAVAQPPPTGTVAGSDSELAASATGESQAKTRVDQAGVKADASGASSEQDRGRIDRTVRRYAASPASPGFRAAGSAVPVVATAASAVVAVMPGQSSPALNAPITPTVGIVDPRAFPASSAAGNASKVRVEIEPADSKVALNGRAAKPPYLFDIPKGSRIVLEIAHAGYITRRVVLDGSREYLKVAMIPEPKSQDPASAPAPQSEVPSEL